MNPLPVSASPTRKKPRLLLWVVLAFVIQAAAWTAWFTIAANHKVPEVPLTTSHSPNQKS